MHKWRSETEARHCHPLPQTFQSLTNSFSCWITLSAVYFCFWISDFLRILLPSSLLSRFDSEQLQRSSLLSCFLELPPQNIIPASPGRCAENVLRKIVNTHPATAAVCKWSSPRERMGILFNGSNGIVGSYLSLLLYFISYCFFSFPLPILPPSVSSYVPSC